MRRRPGNPDSKQWAISARRAAGYQSGVVGHGLHLGESKVARGAQSAVAVGGTWGQGDGLQLMEKRSDGGSGRSSRYGPDLRWWTVSAKARWASYKRAGG